MANKGQNTTFTPKLSLRIKELVLKGVEYKIIMKELGIPKGTWDTWVVTDYQSFRQALLSWKKEKLIKKAERNLDHLLDLKEKEPVVTMIGILKDKDGKVIKKVNPNLLRIKSDATQFTLERLDKENYSSRTDVKVLPPEGLLTDQEVLHLINKYNEPKQILGKTEEGNIGQDVQGQN